MIAYGTNNATNNPSDNTVVVRVAKFPSAGHKLVLQKGTVKISIDAADILPLLDYVKDAAYAVSAGQKA